MLSSPTQPSNGAKQRSDPADCNGMGKETLQESKPGIWLPAFAQQCEFLYVSQYDYYNDEIITRDERREIEQAMSRKTPTLQI